MTLWLLVLFILAVLFIASAFLWVAVRLNNISPNQGNPAQDEANKAFNEEFRQELRNHESL